MLDQYNFPLAWQEFSPTLRKLTIQKVNFRSYTILESHHSKVERLMENQESCILVSAMSLTSCVTLGKSLNL